MKRALGPLCLLFALSLLVSAAPSVTCAQDTARPASGARARRASARARSRTEEPRAATTRKKKSHKARAGVVGDTQPEPDQSDAAGPAATRDKRGKSRGRPETHAAEVTASARARADDTRTTTGEGGSVAAVAAAQASAAGVNAQIVKEGDTSVKVMEFSGLGIEGRLKSPQLVYFTQRVRAEFERPMLPHRSFMPELEASTRRVPVP